jgi:hypothetical protein
MALTHILSYTNFMINEINLGPKFTKYTVNKVKSEWFNDDDYLISFQSKSGEKYILWLAYFEEDNSDPCRNGKFPNIPLYNISFTTEKQHNKSDKDMYEKPTNLFETTDVMSRLSYIICDIDSIIRKKHPNAIYVVGKTKNENKIKFYKKVIKSTSLNFEEEEEGKSWINADDTVFYYKKI